MRRARTRIEGLEPRVLFAAFTVTTTADSGVGSLRQAMLDANASVGVADSIAFSIGTGAQTISPLSALPVLTDTAGVTIDGSTQGGFAAGTPVITIDGASAGAGVNGFEITGGNSVIRDLAIQGFGGDQILTSGGGSNIFLGNVITGTGAGVATSGIHIQSANNRVGSSAAGDRNLISGNGTGINIDGGTGAIVENNRIGTNALGTAAATFPNASGIVAQNASGLQIVGNLVSGNTGAGITLTSAGGALVQNNTIGLNVTGAAAVSNGQGGLVINGSASASVVGNTISGNTGAGITIGVGSGSASITSNKIGTNAAGSAAVANTGAGIVDAAGTSPSILSNQISGNGGDGITLLDGANTAVIRGNNIGANASGTGDLGNGANGITAGSPSDGPTDASIGGTNSGDGNVIAFNDGRGVYVNGGPPKRISILGNSIFSNGQLGIDLSPADGRTANDNDDADSGSNNLQNFPTINQVLATGGMTTIGGTFDGAPSSTIRIEFFTDLTTDTAAAEGRTLVGSTSVTTNAAGVAPFNVTINSVITAGQLVVATATDASGNTSEFSDAIASGTVGPDIQISGNSISITNGDATPSTSDFTDFGGRTVGTSFNRIFTVQNTGQSSLDLSAGVSITGVGAGQFSVQDQPNTTLAAGQSTTFTITFTPTSAGNQAAMISLPSNDPDENPFTFAIAGQGASVTPAPEIEASGNGVAIPSGDVEPGSADDTAFGNGPIGSATPVTRTFTISNAGQQALAVSGVTLGGSGAAQFAVTQQPSTSIAAAGQSTFSVAFNPVAGGQFSATVSIANNDANENPYTFAISGVGVSGADAAPVATLLPQDQQPTPLLNAGAYKFTVRYSDDIGLSVGTFDDGDIVVTGPGGFQQTAQFDSINSNTIVQADVVYLITPPGGTIDPSDNGDYTVTIQPNQVGDSTGNSVASGAIGSFAFALPATRTSLGQFGVVNGRKQKLTFMEDDGTNVTLSLSGGLGEAFEAANGRFDIDVTSSAGKLSIAAKGGNGRAELNDARLTGGVKSFSAKTTDLTGVLSATTLLNSVALGSASGATISTTSPIASLNIAGDLTDSQVFSGANLGADGRFGGTAAAADVSFAAGEIRKFVVGGSVTMSLVAAGLNPVDDELLNGNGIIVGGQASKLGSISVKGAVDNDTFFVAGAFPAKAKIGGQRVITAGDPRFDSTP